MVEQLATRQVLDHHHLHMGIQTCPTDSRIAQNPLSTRDLVTNRSRSLRTSSGSVGSLASKLASGSLRPLRPLHADFVGSVGSPREQARSRSLRPLHPDF